MDFFLMAEMEVFETLLARESTGNIADRLVITGEMF